jgi:hypothetical protein
MVQTAQAQTSKHTSRFCRSLGLKLSQSVALVGHLLLQVDDDAS